MSDPDTTPEKPAAKKKPAAPAPVAKIRAVDTLKARGFTFAKGKVIEGVPLPHAEWLKKEGKAEILEVS